MGTAGYMSPEQVRGKDADHRADIFALGTILYEMLAGKPAFEGQSAVETMNAVLKEDPPALETATGKVAPQLELIVRRCLEKHPEQRFQSASDLGFALGALAAPSGSDRISPAQSQAAATSARDRAGLKHVVWIAVTALLLLTTWAITYFHRAPVEVHPVRFFIFPPENSRFDFLSGNASGPVTVSPDGRRLAFAATTAEGKHLLWVRPPRCPLSAGTRGHGGRHLSHLVAGQPFSGIFRGREAQKDRSRRRAGAHAV